MHDVTGSCVLGRGTLLRSRRGYPSEAKHSGQCRAQRERFRLPESGATRRRFQLILIKPSHYDDDGYVIRWWRTLIPSNSLAALYGLVVDAERRQVLGPDVAFDIEVLDETNTRVNIRKLINRFQQNDNFGMVGLV